MLRPALSSHETLLPRVSGGEGLSNNPGQMVPMFAQALTSTEEGRDRPPLLLLCKCYHAAEEEATLVFTAFHGGEGGSLYGPSFLFGVRRSLET